MQAAQRALQQAVELGSARQQGPKLALSERQARPPERSIPELPKLGPQEQQV